MLDTVVAFLVQEQWPHEVSESGVVHTRYEGDSVDVDCFVETFDDEAQLIVTCVLGIAGADRRRDIAELASRINMYLSIGSFEIDFDDGELRHRVGIPVPASGPDVDLVGTAVYHGVLATDRYAPAFVAVAAGETDPATALEDLRTAVLDE